jgi:glycosyltransferase involved in cell wall biosynthesis
MRAPPVHQFHPVSATGDAVTNGMRLTRQLLRELGFESDVYVQHVGPGLEGDLLPHTALRPDGAVLLVHHSHGHEVEAWLRDLPARQLLVYHNITPARYFHPDSLHHRYSILGREMLSRYRAWMPAALADSEHNAAELRALGYRDVRVVPLLFDLDAIRRAPHARPETLGDDGAFHALFVGRIAANKCQHELVQVAWYLRQLMGRPVRLALVGAYREPDAYYRYLRDVIDRLDLNGEVRLTGHVADEELYGWYRRADVFVCLSEHEGFGVPLVEAMALDRPIVAYHSSSVPETVGSGGLIVARKDHARIAALIAVLQRDEATREALRRGRRARLESLSRERLKAGLAAFLQAQGVAVPRPPAAPRAA